MFPIGVLKIDKSLLHGAGAGSREERLLRSVLSMARSLELQSVVEGVETEAQARAVIEEAAQAGPEAAEEGERAFEAAIG
jgi:EAL domain-containing protein (putative c-di-GMP-specific phosphodiesterase class I)